MTTKEGHGFDYNLSIHPSTLLPPLSRGFFPSACCEYHRDGAFKKQTTFDHVLFNLQSVGATRIAFGGGWWLAGGPHNFNETDILLCAYHARGVHKMSPL